MYIRCFCYDALIAGLVWGFSVVYPAVTGPAGHRSHTHSAPLFKVVPCLFFPMDVATCPCVSHKWLAAVSCSSMGHLSPDPRDHSLLSVCWMTDCTAPPHYLQQPTQASPHLHTSLDALQTQLYTYDPVHAWGSSDNLLFCRFILYSETAGRITMWHVWKNHHKVYMWGSKILYIKPSCVNICFRGWLPSGAVMVCVAGAGLSSSTVLSCCVWFGG